MSVKNVLPPAEVTRAKILDSKKITLDDLQKRVEKMMRNKALAKNLALLYSIISEQLGIPVEVTTGVFAASPEEMMNAEEFLLINDLKTTELPVVNLRGYFLGIAKEGSFDQNDGTKGFWCLIKLGDESGYRLILVGNDKVEIFMGEEAIDLGIPVFLSNMQVDEYDGAPSVKIDQSVDVRIIETGEARLPPLADIKLDLIVDLPDTQYPMIKGLVSKIDSQKIIVCDQAGHKLPIKEVGVPVHCEKCNDEMVTAETGFEHIVILGDESGEIPVKFWANNDIDLEDFPVGSGMIVSVRYQEKYKNATGYTAISYDPFAEYLKIESEKPSEPVKKTTPKKKELNWEELDFSIDKEATTPDEVQMDALTNSYEEIFSNYGFLSPFQLQEFYAGRFDGVLFEMRNLVQLIAGKHSDTFRIEDGKFAIKDD